MRRTPPFRVISNAAACAQPPATHGIGHNQPLQMQAVCDESEGLTLAEQRELLGGKPSAPPYPEGQQDIFRALFQDRFWRG